MKPRIFNTLQGIILFSVILAPLRAQFYTTDVPIHNSSSVPASARFEIVQSQRAEKWTFCLDRYVGEVWMLVTHESGFAWEKMAVKGHDASSAATGRPHFQLFLSGLTQDVLNFLVDTDSGEAWILKTRSGGPYGLEKSYIWAPMRNFADSPAVNPSSDAPVEESTQKEQTPNETPVTEKPEKLEHTAPPPTATE